MLCDVPVHTLAAGDLQLLQSSRNHAGHQEASSAHLRCSLRLKRGCRYALVGKNGCGKTTLLQAVASGALEGWPRGVQTLLVGQRRLPQKDTVLDAVAAQSDRSRALMEEAAELEERLASASLGDEEGVQALADRIAEIYDILGDEDESSRRPRARSILSGLGFDAAAMAAAVGGLSRGWQSRAALAAGLLGAPDLLMLDEPTKDLDLEAISWLERYLVHEFTGTLLCASHDRHFINATATETILLADSTLEYFRGSVDGLERRRAQQSRCLQRQAAALQRKKEHVMRSIQALQAGEARALEHRSANKENNRYGQYSQHGSGAGGEQSTRQIAQRLKKLDRMGLEKTPDGKRYRAQDAGGPRVGAASNNDGGWVDGRMTAAELHKEEEPLAPFAIKVANPLGLPVNEAVLELRGVDFQLLDEEGPCLKGVNLTLATGSRVAIKGPNGSGKSLLLGVVAGQLVPCAGEVWRTPGLTTGYLEQEHVDWMLRQSYTPLQYVRLHAGVREDQATEALATFGVDEELVGRGLRTLSGGQCMRVALARLAAAEPHLLVLDEPTSFLDIYSIASLEEALREFEGAVVFATHDRQLVEAIATDVAELSRGREGLAVEQICAATVPEGTQKRDRLWREPEAPS